MEQAHGAFDDDTSVNAIQLFCRTKGGEHTGDITSSVLKRGYWTGSHHCHRGYLNGYDLKVSSVVYGKEMFFKNIFFNMHSHSYIS